MPSPKDWTAIRREIRTLKIQSVLSELIEVDFDVESNLLPMKFMYDWCLVPGDTEECVLRTMREYYASITEPDKKDVLDKLEKWLDQTESRLMKIKITADNDSLKGNARRINGTWTSVDSISEWRKQNFLTDEKSQEKDNRSDTIQQIKNPFECA